MSSGKLLLVKSSRVERAEGDSIEVSCEDRYGVFLVAGVCLFGCGALRIASIENGNTLLLVPL